ncbi:MAG: hypothetical protein OXC44_05515 [Proteobacteria bacterium]|nr:hypothetical protein [Pseudomonadota bacterium]
MTVSDVTREKKFSIFDPEDLTVEALLFQSSYLSIDQKVEQHCEMVYRLKYPNFEVQKYLAEGLLTHVTDGKITMDHSRELVALLVKNNFKSFTESLEVRLAGIPYQWHQQDLARYEAWYAGLLLLYMGFCSQVVDVGAEESSSHGRYGVAGEESGFCL